MLPDLADLQRRFRTAVLGSSDDAVSSFMSEETAQRMGVYRNTVQESLIAVLATAFPVVQRIVGEAFFAALARSFITTYPPRRAQLSLYGAELPAFIRAADVNRQLPYLADVAALEWSRGEAYFAADAATLDAVQISQASPEKVEALTLTLHPATRLVRSPFPIFRIWEVNQPSVTDVPVVDMTIGENALVTRVRHHVATRAISHADTLFIEALGNGETLSAAATASLTKDPAFDLQAALALHFTNGTFRALR